MERFKKLGIGEHLLKSLQESGFESPKEIQEKAIPLAMAGKDIIGGSATGSGKTLAFGASIIERSEKGAGIQALILTPTRELCEQVAHSLGRFAKHKKLFVTAIYGGVGMSPQVEDLHHAEIVVGTPGRILDHLERGFLKLGKVKTLVLDEADRMLDMGFIDDVERIISQCPKQRQTFLFSATISQEIEHIAGKHMKNPVIISAESMVDPTKLKQVYYDVPSELKFSLLVHLLKYDKSGLVMVFTNTRHNAEFIASNLKRYDIEAIAIHGGLTQSRRSNIMELFKSSKLSVLVCTDVAARGLDIKGVSHVYNYDVPKTSDEYIHRIGRTARAGKEGIAVSIVSNRDYSNFQEVMSGENIKIEKIEIPSNIIQVNISFAGARRRGGLYNGGGGFRGGGRSGGRSFGGAGGGRERRESSEGGGFGRGRSFAGGGFRGGGSRGEGRERSSSGLSSGRSSGGFGRGGGRSSSSHRDGERRSFGGGGRGGRFGGRERSSGSSSRGRSSGGRSRSYGRNRY